MVDNGLWCPSAAVMQWDLTALESLCVEQPHNALSSCVQVCGGGGHQSSVTCGRCYWSNHRRQWFVMPVSDKTRAWRTRQRVARLSIMEAEHLWCLVVENLHVEARMSMVALLCSACAQNNYTGICTYRFSTSANVYYTYKMNMNGETDENKTDKLTKLVKTPNKYV